MSEVEKLKPAGERMRRVIMWISETVKENPRRSRKNILREAEIKFDLSPLECEFLDSRLSEGNLTMEETGP